MKTRTHNRKGGLVLAAVAAVALMGGSAFTASVTTTAVDGATVGHGTTSVSGGTVTSLTYDLTDNGSAVHSVALKLDGDTTGSDVSIGFNADADVLTSCTAGAYDDVNLVTPYTCDNGGTGLDEPTDGLNSTEIVINSAATA